MRHLQLHAQNLLTYLASFAEEEAARAWRRPSEHESKIGRSHKPCFSSGSFSAAGQFSKDLIMRALDTPEILTSRAAELASAGYRAIGKYLRGDRTTPEEIQALKRAGLRVWGVWEKGNPTSAEYFSSQRGNSDAVEAVAFASTLGVPSDAPIFFAVDYDASDDELHGPIFEYIETAHEYVRSCGLLLGVYGSGLTCKVFANVGFAHFTWLAQSTGWQGYQAWVPHADILQGLGSCLGLNSDPDNVVNPAVLW